MFYSFFKDRKKERKGNPTKVGVNREESGCIGEAQGRVLRGLESTKLRTRHSCIKQEAGQPNRSVLKSAV